MVVNAPRIVESIANDPRDMVRVQLKPNDVRSYTRLEAEKLIATGMLPGAFIVGDPVADSSATNEDTKEEARLSGEGSNFEEAAADLKTKAAAKSQRSAPNKARTTAAPKPAGPSPSTSAPPVETKTAAPPESTTPATSTPAAESQAE